MTNALQRFYSLSLALFVLSASLTAEVKIADTSADTLVIGADAYGRGGTYLAASDSNHYVFQNYSFLNSRQQPRISLATFQLLDDVNYLTAAYTHGNFSFGFMNISDSSGYLRDENNNLLGSKISYNDSTFYAAYGLGNEILGAGIRLKYYSRAYSGVDASASGTAMDLAAFTNPVQYITFGLEACNLIGSGLQWSNDQQEEFLKSYGLGIRLKLAGPEGLLRMAQALDIYLDTILNDDNSFCHFGLEYWCAQPLVLRLGLNQYLDVDSELRENLKYSFTAGLGFNWNDFYFDYAYNPGDIAENVSHFFTLAYRFGKPVKPEKQRKELKTLKPTTADTAPEQQTKETESFDWEKIFETTTTNAAPAQPTQEIKAGDWMNVFDM